MAAEVKAGRWGHKYGPLPLWAWGGLALGGALGLSAWRKNKAAKTTATVDQASTVSTSQTPPYVVINDLYTGTTTTPQPVAAPPVSGDKDKDKPPPTPAPVPTPQPVPVPVPIAPPVDSGTRTGGYGSPPPIRVAEPAPVTPAPAPVVRSTSPLAYKVQPGDNLSKIAAKFGVFGGNGVSLYNYNITSAGRSPQDVAVLKQRGPGLIYSGETIYIPR
jgi:LysM repeat protein